MGGVRGEFAVCYNQIRIMSRRRKDAFLIAATGAQMVLGSLLHHTESKISSFR